MVISLTLALGVTALTANSAAHLRLARADLERTQTEAMLAGAHQHALLAMLTAGPSGRFTWTASTGGGTARVLAEPEADKISVEAAASLGDRAFKPLGLEDVATARSNLKRLVKSAVFGADLQGVDPSPRWRACAGSLLSIYGGAKTFQLAPAQSPRGGEPVLRTGEVWRIRVAAPGGWTDDRLVRFTGDQLHPAAVILRRFTKTAPGGEACDATFSAG
jgi:hypothetical protein